MDFTGGRLCNKCLNKELNKRIFLENRFAWDYDSIYGSRVKSVNLHCREYENTGVFMKYKSMIGKISIVMILVMLSVCMTSGSTFSSEASGKPLAGKTISIMGDSISTYAGWSDSRPITSPEYANRYGEAYYGPAGGDYHNTDLLVTDTWWHQAAAELGAEVLMSNATNSSGLLHASYPSDEAWEQYLKDMLAYKSRPEYMGYNGKSPDIIALYIGSNDVAKVSVSGFGSMDNVDMSTLISVNADGSFTHKTPETVAEAYAILMFKLKNLYPDAVIYLFTVVPNAGGNQSAVNKRLKACYPFNEMIRGVADYFDAYVVDIFDEFNIDPDGDSNLAEKDYEAFRSYYHNDPHPNAAGFDVITRRFVKTVLETYPFDRNPETGDTVSPVFLISISAASVICFVSAITAKRRRTAA